MILSGATTPGQSGPRSAGNEGVFCIPQSISGTSPSDCLVLYPGHSLVVGYVLPLCREAVSVFYNPSQLGKFLGYHYAIQVGRQIPPNFHLIQEGFDRVSLNVWLEPVDILSLFETNFWVEIVGSDFI